jgi:ABC-2 type transport system ATP-binding protein
MNTAVEVAHLSKQYGSLLAVDDVSLSVEQGEILGILGPNGAGKTTLVEMIEGLRRPDRGSILLLGLDGKRDRKQIREIVGVQLQSTTLYDRIRVREALVLFGGYYRRALPVESLLRSFALTEKQHAFVSSLSGGQKQRLALALAVVNDPKLLFLDEPTTGLDPQARRNLWEIIRGLRDQGKTVVLTTHSMEEAEELCHRVAIMDQGRIIALDRPATLIAEAGLDSTVELSANERLRAAVEGAGLAVKILPSDGRFLLQTADPSGVLTQLTQIAAQTGIVLEDLTVRKATLEDVFLSMTGRQLRE